MELKLNKLSNFTGRKGPLLLVILDGAGIGKKDDSDAFYSANTPVLDELMKGKLYTELKAHGTAVGLPSDGDMGNSEVGHNAMGAGRVFDQGAKLVNKSFDTGAIFDSDLWKKIINRGKDGKTVHFIGLLSDGNVHSHINHINKMIKNCEKEGIKNVRIHPLLDGRDVGEKSALEYIEPLEELLSEINNNNNDYSYKIASGGGRMNVTMDRYNANWPVVKKGWDAHVLGKARGFKSASEAVKTYYEEDPNITDQYLDSFVIVDNNDNPVGEIKDGDSVVFFNFRGDRAIEISRAFDEKDFKEFDRERYPDVLYAGMMLYDGDMGIPKNYLVHPPKITQTASEYMCAEKINIFAISETQKYGHVTYFWNGNKSGYIDENLEVYIEIPSDKIEFDKAPDMKAYEITDKTIELLNSGNFRYGRLNYPNGDMVGHTGKFDAAVRSMETVDKCVGKLLETVKKLDGIAVITADHGNCDEMYTIKKGEKKVSTAHSLNPVPFIIYDPNYNNEYSMRDLGHKGLSNIAATVFNLMGYEKPDIYDESLIQFN